MPKELLTPCPKCDEITMARINLKEEVCRNCNFDMPSPMTMMSHKCKPGPYREQYLCVCGYYCEPWRQDLFFLDFDMCPGCGKHSKHQFRLITRRWVDTSVWYKPWTWCDGFWEQPRY